MRPDFWEGAWPPSKPQNEINSLLVPLATEKNEYFIYGLGLADEKLYSDKNKQLLNEVKKLSIDYPLEDSKFQKEYLILHKDKLIDLNDLNDNYYKKQIYQLPQAISIQYKPQFASLSTDLANGLFVDSHEKITAENIAEFAYPLAQFVEAVKPDYIIACDRGARMIGLAVHMMYNRLYGALPTKDHSIRFRKISTNVDLSVVEQTLRVDVERMLTETENPTLLVLDDWITSGRTRQLITSIIDDFSDGRINLLFAVMRGKGADVSGNPLSSANCDWHDNPQITGVDYSSKGGFKPQKVKDTFEARSYRQRMARSITKYAEEVRKESSSRPLNSS